jgi:hypothetical protein
MHLVRRALLRSEPSTATVTQIVTDHGFWELGRFSAYRALFGESPSQTLRQPTWQCSRGLNPAVVRGNASVRRLQPSSSADRVDNLTE